MNQNQQALCTQHKKQMKYIDDVDGEYVFYCEKCKNIGEYAQEVEALLNQFKMVKPEKDGFLENYSKYIEGKVQRVKQEFSSTIEMMWKYFRETLQKLNNLIITEEQINYYTTNTLNKDDLKQFAKLYFSNFQLNQNQEYKKTKNVIKQELDNIAHKFKSIKRMQKKIRNLIGNEDEHLNPSDQSADEKISEFEFKAPKSFPFKKFSLVNQLKFEKRIQGVTLSQDDNFAFAFSEDLPLTSFKIIDKQLIPHQQILQNQQLCRNLLFNMKENKLMFTLDKKIFFYQQNENTFWIKDLVLETQSQIFEMVLGNGKIITLSSNGVQIFLKDSSQQFLNYEFPHNENRIEHIAINQLGNILVTFYKNFVQLWNISNDSQIVLIQKVDLYGVIRAEFFDGNENILCLMKSQGDFHMLKQDNKGIYQETQWISRSKSTYGCTIRFCNQGQELILGNHIIQIYQQDEQNDFEWSEQQQFKVNCWHLEISKNSKILIGTDFNSICLFVRDV